MERLDLKRYTTGLTIDMLASMLQKERNDILYVCNDVLHTADDLNSLGLKQGAFAVVEAWLKPELTWILSAKHSGGARQHRELCFFRKDAVEYLTGGPVEDPTQDLDDDEADEDSAN